MIVKCPSCSARFRIPEDKIKPSGTKVRCGGCRSVFRVALSAPVSQDIGESDRAPAQASPELAGLPAEGAPGDPLERQESGGSPRLPEREARGSSLPPEVLDWPADDSWEVYSGDGAQVSGVSTQGQPLPLGLPVEGRRVSDDDAWSEQSKISASVTPGPSGVPLERDRAKSDHEMWSDAFPSAPPPRPPIASMGLGGDGSRALSESSSSVATRVVASPKSAEITVPRGPRPTPQRGPRSIPQTVSGGRAVAWLSVFMAALVMVGGFLSYVAFANDGVLDLTDMGTMVAVAFKGHPIPDVERRVIRVFEVEGEIVEEPVDGSANIERSLGLSVEDLAPSRYVRPERLPLILIQGRLRNQSEAPHRRIVVGARIYDNGVPVAQAVAPVGAPVTQEQLDLIELESDVAAMYDGLREDAFGLVIETSAASLFTLVFPLDVAPATSLEALTYDVDVVQAEHLDTEGRWRRIVYSRRYAEP